MKRRVLLPAATPDLTMVARSGVPGCAIASFAGWFVPAGTPPRAVARLDEYGMPAVLAAEATPWGNSIRAAGIRAE